MNAHMIGVSLPMAVLRPGDGDMGADDPAGELLELSHLFPDSRLNGVGMRNAVKRNLKRNLYDITFLREGNAAG